MTTWLGSTKLNWQWLNSQHNVKQDCIMQGATQRNMWILLQIRSKGRPVATAGYWCYPMLEAA